MVELGGKLGIVDMILVAMVAIGLFIFGLALRLHIMYSWTKKKLGGKNEKATIYN